MGDDRACILVIDDAREFLEFMALLLTGEGFRVLVAPSLSEARRLLTGTRPQLIIADVRLAGSPPFAALDQVRADDAARAVPVVLCTGAIVEVEQRKYQLRRDGVEVVLKPFDIDDLLARIRRLCEDGSGRSPE